MHHNRPQSLVNVRQCYHRSGGKLLFQGLEALLALGRPLKLIGLLQKVGHKLGYLGKVLNEVVVVSCQPKKTLDISRIAGLFPFFYNFYLGGINSYSLSSENVT